MITATKPFQPPLDEFKEKIDEIYQNSWFTNHGPMVTELEKKLQSYFNVPYLALVTNGTIAIQIAIKALELKGEIITTPFSYVATTSSIVWENCIPRFADINRQTLNIDPQEIEKLINEKTSGILATNVFGYPCDFEPIKRISEKFNIPVIYDNAHGFATKINGKDILNFGDISTISFHATKLFHTIEGGAIVCHDEALYKKILRLRNFGHTSPNTFNGVGINGKMNEINSAMGLVNLNYINEILEKRKKQWLFYFESLNKTNLELMAYDLQKIEYNYSYFPIILKSENLVLKLLKELELHDVSARRYFNPSLNKLNYLPVIDHCEFSEDISSRILCLPLYHELQTNEQNLIVNIIKSVC